MALQFNPPEWLIQDYLKRKTPWEEASEGVQTGIKAYMDFDESKRKNALAKLTIEQQRQLLDLKKREDERQGREAFYSYGDPAALPLKDRGALNPVQGPLAEGQQEPLVPSYDPNNPSSIDANYLRGFKEKFPSGEFGVKMEKISAEAEKDRAMAKRYGMMPGGSPKTLDALLAQRVQDGELTLEEAISLKQKQNVPSGYRLAGSGLEPIPGGPVDQKGAKEDEKIKNAMELYETARDGLLFGLEGSTTGPVAGRIPAVTEAQQTAEGGVAAMAPVLKQLFRVSGEGVFTDRDQALLLDMIPTRKDHPGARRKKIDNIDAIVKAKLGLGGKTSSVSGGLDPEKKSRLEELRRKRAEGTLR